MRCNDNKDLTELLKILRQGDSPQELAECLLHQIHGLQERQIIAKTDLDIHDVLSLAVEGLSQSHIGRRPHGPGSWGELSSLIVPDHLPGFSSGSQTDGRRYDAYLGSLPAYDREVDGEPLVSDHTLTEDPDDNSQFSFDPSLLYNQSSSALSLGQAFSYDTTPLLPGEIDPAVPLRSGCVVAGSKVLPGTYLTDEPLIFDTNQLTSTHYMNAPPNVSVLADRLSGAGTALDAPVESTAEWDASQGLLDGFAGPWSQDIANRAGRLNLTLDVDASGVVIPRVRDRGQMDDP